MKFIITESQKKQLIKYSLLEEDETSGTTVGSIMSKVIDYVKQSLRNQDSTPTRGRGSVDTSISNFVGSVDDKWMNITKQVIDKFEGGYWNPECGHPTKGMGKSTETMFGLDRKNGGWDKSTCGKKFFGLIDAEKDKLGKSEFCKVWKHGYKGGSLENELKNIASSCMKDVYERNMKTFPSEVKQKIESNPGLLIHFSYACWNGPGYFQTFAKSIKRGIEEKLSDDELIKLAIKDRKNSNLYHQDKVASVINNVSNIA